VGFLGSERGFDVEKGQRSPKRRKKKRRLVKGSKPAFAKEDDTSRRVEVRPILMKQMRRGESCLPEVCKSQAKEGIQRDASAKGEGEIKGGTGQG